VQANLGDKLNENFRLWYTDHALHGDVSIEDDPTRTVGYLGVLQQALLDLSAWVEKDIAPAASTQYKIDAGQVIVPQTANERKGIQPVVTLRANGGKRAEINAGQSVTFTAEVEVPENIGKLVAAAWNFEGLSKEVERQPGWNFDKSDAFPVSGKIVPSDRSGSRVTIEATHMFSKPGTYFPTLRIASQRHGNAKTPYTRIQNLDRVRVVVK